MAEENSADAADGQQTTDATANDAGDKTAEGQADNQNQTTEPDKSGDQSGEGEGNTEIKYEDFKLPEGVQPEKELLNSFTPYAAKHGLTQEQAQELVTLYADWLKTHDDAQAQSTAELHKSWGESIASDKEIGGAALDNNLAYAAKVIDKFGGDEIREIFDVSGIGNHPNMVKMFIKIGKAFAEDTLTPGEKQTEGRPSRSHAETLYPNQGKE